VGDVFLKKLICGESGVLPKGEKGGNYFDAEEKKGLAIEGKRKKMAVYKVVQGERKEPDETGIEGREK